MKRACRRARHSTLVLSGSFRVADIAELVETMHQYIRKSAMLTIDLSDVHDIDRIGVQALLFAKETVESRGTRLILQNPSEQLQQVARATGLDTHFSSSLEKN